MDIKMPTILLRLLNIQALKRMGRLTLHWSVKLWLSELRSIRQRGELKLFQVGFFIMNILVKRQMETKYVSHCDEVCTRESGNPSGLSLKNKKEPQQQLEKRSSGVT